MQQSHPVRAAARRSPTNSADSTGGTDEAQQTSLLQVFALQDLISQPDSPEGPSTESHCTKRSSGAGFLPRLPPAGLC